MPTPTAAPPGRGRLATTSSQRRWGLAVVASGTVAATLAATGVPGAIAVAAGLAGAVVGVGEVVVALVVARFQAVGRGIAEHRTRLERLLVHQFVDGSTHGWLADAEDALASAQTRWDSRAGPQPCSAQTATVARSIDEIHQIERSLVDSRPFRATWNAGAPTRLFGGFAASVAGEDPATVVRLYSDPVNAPDWLGPRTRRWVVRLGVVLDDVRVLHNAEIEWAILLFTLWSRALLVAGAPILASVSLGRLPLRGGWNLADLPWALATGWAVATALVAPWIATAVMGKDTRGRRVRTSLLAIEVPIALALLLSTPCWPAAVFAAGWTNWWQRPHPSLTRHLLWVVLVGAGLAAGLALHDASASASAAAAELAGTMLAVGVTGGSYGAMLPVCASILASTLVGGLLSSRRARVRADARIGEAIAHLLEAAHAIEERAAGDPLATRDARRLRECATALGRRAHDSDRWARRTPLGLQQLIESALRDAGVMQEEPQAAVLLHEAALAGEPEPVTIEDPVFHQRHLRGARLRERRVARTLSLLINEIVREARRHGTGPLLTVCRLDGDRLVVQFANPVRPGPTRPGRGTGAENLRALAAALPGGRIDVRDVVPGSFVDLPDAFTRFGVQVSLSAAAIVAIVAIEDNPR